LNTIKDRVAPKCGNKKISDNIIKKPSWMVIYQIGKKAAKNSKKISNTNTFQKK